MEKNEQLCGGPVVSVVMPSLNVCSYIREALESVACQTLKNIEIICVDAGSTDGTLEVIKEFVKKDSRIRLIMSEVRSYGHQLNLGMKAASGRYMGIVETDDVIAPDMYERLSEVAREFDAEVVKADYYHFSGFGEGRQLQVRHCANAEDLYGQVVDPATDPRAYCFTIICGNLYSLDFLRKNGIVFNETLGASYQDIGFFYQVHGYAHRMFFLKAPFYMYRQDNPGSSINNRGKVYACCVEYEWLRTQLKRNPEVYAASKTYFGRGMYFGYMGALKRIAKEFRGEFIERFSKDLRSSNSRGELDANLFDKTNWVAINDIMERPLQFLEKFARESIDVKVSVIIPVYNAVEYIGTCLNSVLEQDLREIEVICIDDGSTDNSLDLLRKCAARDSRIVVISQPNGGGSAARNHGLEHARGEYVAFMDSDDLYPGTNVLSMLYKAVTREKVDVAGGQLERFSPSNPERIERPRMFPFLKPGLNVYARNPFDFCYQLFIFNRRMLIDNGIFFPVVSRYQDPLFMVKAMEAARTFYFIDFPAYRYRFGHQNIDWCKNDFRKTRDMLSSMAEVVGFSVSKGLTRIVEATKWRVLHDYADVLFSRVPNVETFPEFQKLMASFPEYTARDIVRVLAGRKLSEVFQSGSTEQMLRRLEQDLGALDFVKQLAKTYFSRRDELIVGLDRIQYVPQIRNRKIKRIGFMYYMLTMGGVQRVMAMLTPVFQKLGYEVVFIIEKKLDDECIELPDGVSVRYVMESQYASSTTVETRIQQLSDVIDDEKLDLIYYHSYSSHLLIWDMLTAKLVHHIPFLVHYHSCVGITLCEVSSVPEISILCAKLRMCDRVITLGRMDELYFRAQGVNATYIVNPVDDQLRKDLSKQPEPAFEEQQVIWCGRVSPEKRPLDAIRIFAHVHAQLPSARMTFVGGGAEWLMSAVQSEVQSSGLSDCIEITGNLPDPYPVFKRSAVFLMTPEYEGYALTLFEAGVFGVPAVTYAMPFLETIRDNSGVIQIPDRNVVAAAAAIVDILSDKRKFRKMSQANHDHMKRLASFELDKAWKSVLDGLQNPHVVDAPISAVPLADVRMLLEECQDCYRVGFDKQKKRYAEKSQNEGTALKTGKSESKGPGGGADEKFPVNEAARRVQSLAREVESLKCSESYRVGMFITWPLRMVKRLMFGKRKSR